MIILEPIGIGMFSGALLAQPRVNAMLDNVGLSFVDRIPSAWDYTFWQFKVREGGFVKIYLSDGSVTGGLVRAASTSPSQRDLFIDQVWNLDSDRNFISPVPDNIGLWVPHDEIGRLEFYQPGEDSNDQQDPDEEIFDAEARADPASYRHSGH